MSRGHEWARNAIDGALIELRQQRPETTRLEALAAVAAKATELRGVARRRVAFAGSDSERNFWTDVGEHAANSRERATDAVRVLAQPPRRPQAQLEIPGVL